MPLNIVQITFRDCDPASEEDFGRKDPGIIITRNNFRAVVVRLYDTSGKITKRVHAFEKRENRFLRMREKAQDAHGIRGWLYNLRLKGLLKARALSAEQRLYPWNMLEIACREDAEVRPMQSDGKFRGSIELRKDLIQDVSLTARQVVMRIYEPSELDDTSGAMLHEMHF